ncbi:AAA family ATPase [Patescibacteria group bacterium]|nr:AAA family ATPase [Patescibacteria group bacterium]MCG2809105.1 AAA family ATPase [Candidatus Portnoybacteria bacterium]
MEKINLEQWQKVEEKVGGAEIAERKKRSAEVELYEETGLTKAEREKMGKEKLLEQEDIAEIVKELESEKKALVQETEEILGSADSPERALATLRKENLWKSLREDRKIELEKEQLLEKESELLRSIGEAQEKGKPARGKSAILEKTRERLNGLKKERAELLESSPEAYFGLNLKELKEYKKDLAKGRIVETPYVKEQAEDIAAHLRANKPVMLYGHLGSGKTELAMHIAKEYIGKEALIISGSKHTSLAELYGHQILSVDKVNKEELDGFTKEVERKFEKWVKENPKAEKDEKNLAHDRILQTYLTQFKSGTISDFFMGPVYRAMAEGRPVIVDEVNAIPHEILISLNHILTRKVGEQINVQQNTGTQVEVKEGFGVIMTGNLNQGQEKYIERQDMDPAFLSRLYKLEYKYLPQKTEGGLEDEAGKENELFHLLLAEVMDKNGDIEAPKDSIKKLWNLAKAARVTQDVFAGKEVANAYYFQEAGGRAAKYLLKESVLSIRAIENVLGQWKKEGYKQEIDYYIWKEFVSQSAIASDKAYLYQLLKDRFNFFQSEGWEQNPDYGSGGVVNVFDIKAPENPSAEKKFFGPRETVEFAFGKAPERAKWPEAKGEIKEKTEINLEEMEELEEFKNIFAADLENLGKDVGDFCAFGVK